MKIDLGTGSNLITRNPAEASTVVGAIVALISYFSGIHDAGVLLAMAVVIGALPTAIKWLITQVRQGRGEVAVVLPQKLAERAAEAVQAGTAEETIIVPPAPPA